MVRHVRESSIVCGRFTKQHHSLGDKGHIEIRPLTTDELSPETLEAFLAVGFTNHYEILGRRKTIVQGFTDSKKCAKNCLTFLNARGFVENHQLHFQTKICEKWPNFPKRLSDRQLSPCGRFFSASCFSNMQRNWEFLGLRLDLLCMLRNLLCILRNLLCMLRKLLCMLRA